MKRSVNRPSREKPGGDIQSLVRAFGLLQAIADSPDGISHTQLSRRTGLNSTTVFYLLKTMLGLGYIRQSEETKRYYVGSAAFCLAIAALGEVQLADMAQPVLKETAVRSGMASLFGIRSGEEMIVVAKAEGNGAFRISDRVGGLRPSHCTGMGKVLLAAMPPQELEQYLRNYELKPYTPNTITGRARLMEELIEVRASGVALDNAEFHAELRCAAAPVHDFTGRLVGALAISGPTWRLSLQLLKSHLPLLRHAAQALSEQLGSRMSQAPDRRLGGIRRSKGRAESTTALEEGMNP